MPRYVLLRLGQAAVVLWAAYTVSFLVLVLLPGDAVAALTGAAGAASSVSPERLAELRREYGVDEPPLVQYAAQLGDAVTGDLGASFATGRPVTALLAEALPPTLTLTLSALTLALVLGAGIALAATYGSRPWLRQLLLSLPPLVASVPAFWVGLMLIQLLSFRFRLFPAFGDDGVRGLVLPALTLAVPTAAIIAQVLARSLMTALAEPYVRTARAKGAGPVRVHVRHALRNASLPALTVAGLLVGGLLANSVLVETVFSRNGLGRVVVSAVTTQDIPVVQGVVVLSAAVFVAVNLLVDLLSPLLDPRIALGGPR
ncbi:ABC transporter permease [Actinocorallia sp. A-T 12471]|uniref:ABC transporter permease n=1 Tax=Actinocorallia sp. A-T 12471 TaxID=3089813 RepID=UPI0029D1C011|nr:ABC transporter permease [Actinocorallia sp. A-T 12471]MDX6743126.1 ABC transporter permease [Actinocorallia sp. A-T 12471]